MREDGAPDFIIKPIMSDRHMFFFLIYKIGDWSLEQQVLLLEISSTIILIELRRKQRFKVKTCPPTT